MTDNHKNLVKLAATYSLSCDGWVPVKVADWNFFIDSVNELTEENARLREALKKAHDWLKVDYGYLGSPVFDEFEQLLKGDEDE